MLARVTPDTRFQKVTSIHAITKCVDSERAYVHLEAAHDAVIDFKLKELGKGTRNFMRIRTMRNVTYNSERHPLKIGDNFEITLDESK